MARILIVDDQALNRELLHAHFEGSGHQLFDAESGDEALRLAAEVTPDLVLLDVMMPGMNGFEATIKLKAQAGEDFLPVILLTSLSDQASVVTGLKMGADDYLTKPVDINELRLRTKNLLALRDKTQALMRHNVELLEMARFKEEMTGLLVHDLKSPMSVISANLHFIGRGLDGADEGYLEALRDSEQASRRMLRLIANILDLASMETNRLQLRRTATNIRELVGQVAAQRMYLVEARKLVVRVEVDDPPVIEVDPDLISRVAENVFDNAIRYTPSGGSIEVQLRRRDGTAQLRIGNTGEPIPREARAAIFEKFGQTGLGSGRMNMGLGLYFCRLAAEAHGGKIWVEETPQLPTVFVLQLPVSA